MKFHYPPCAGAYKPKLHQCSCKMMAHIQAASSERSVHDTYSAFTQQKPTSKEATQLKHTDDACLHMALRLKPDAIV